MFFVLILCVFYIPIRILGDTCTWTSVVSRSAMVSGVFVLYCHESPDRSVFVMHTAVRARQEHAWTP